jgi:hypothetical protein
VIIDAVHAVEAMKGIKGNLSTDEIINLENQLQAMND